MAEFFFYSDGAKVLCVACLSFEQSLKNKFPCAMSRHCARVLFVSCVCEWRQILCVQSVCFGILKNAILKPLFFTHVNKSTCMYAYMHLGMYVSVCMQPGDIHVYVGCSNIHTCIIIDGQKRLSTVYGTGFVPESC